MNKFSCHLYPFDDKGDKKTPEWVLLISDCRAFLRQTDAFGKLGAMVPVNGTAKGFDENGLLVLEGPVNITRKVRK